MITRRLVFPLMLMTGCLGFGCADDASELEDVAELDSEAWWFDPCVYATPDKTTTVIANGVRLYTDTVSYATRSCDRFIVDAETSSTLSLVPIAGGRHEWSLRNSFATGLSEAECDALVTSVKVYSRPKGGSAPFMLEGRQPFDHTYVGGKCLPIPLCDSVIAIGDPTKVYRLAIEAHVDPDPTFVGNEIPMPVLLDFFAPSMVP